MPRSHPTYVDTSVWCAYCFNQADSAAVTAWLEQADFAQLGASWWAETEFGSALGIQLRSKALTARLARAASERFADLMNAVRRLNVIEHDHLQAAQWCAQPIGKLRGGDALHLAVAQRHGCTHLATLDSDMRDAAAHLGLTPIKLS